MNKNIVKNILVGVSAAALIVFSLVSNPFNLAGMIIAIVSIILLGLLLFLYRKEDDLTSKSDLYLLLLVTGITGGKFGVLMECFDHYALSDISGKIRGLGFLYLGIAIAATLISRKAFKKVALIKRLIGTVGITFTLAYTFGGNLNVYDYFILGAIICFYLFTATMNDIGKNNKTFGRSYWITLATMAVFIIRRMLFPAYEYSSDSLMGTLNFKILPFYFLGSLILIAAAVIALDAKADEGRRISNDSILFGGLASLAVVTKCSVFFHFYYSWIAILFGAFILLAIAFRHAACFNKTSWKFELKNWRSNPFFFMIFVELGLALIVSQICYGHVYFAAALFISYFIITVIPNAFKGWRKDFVQSFAYTFSIALLACTRVITVGYSLKKILLIAAIFVFTVFILCFVDHNNEVGHNKYKIEKAIMIAIFALLMIIPIYKGGANVKIEADEKENLVCNYVIEPTSLTVRTKADGKNNDVEAVKYVFSDNYTYDPSRVIEVDGDTFNVDITDSHLIVWVTDSNGMDTRRDFWFEAYSYSYSEYGRSSNFLARIEKIEPVKTGQNYNMYNKHFYNNVINAEWGSYGNDDLEPGLYYKDVSRISFFVDAINGFSDEIYYAYYYSKDGEFDSEDLETPVYAYSVSPKNNSYDLVYRKKIMPGFYILVAAADDSFNEPYILAYGRVLNEEAPRAETVSARDQNRTYIDSLPDAVYYYADGFINVDPSLFEMSYSELDDRMNGDERLPDLQDWEEDDLEADEKCDYGPVTFKFYDETCVSMIYAYSAGSYGMETLKSIYSSHLGDCDYVNYDQDSGELNRFAWYGSEINIIVFLQKESGRCIIEFECPDRVI